MDSAHFFYGTDDPQVEFHPGVKTLNEFLGDDGEDFDAGMSRGSYGSNFVIEEGRRNATMSRFAGRIVKRYGATEQAFKIFMEEAGKCNPPLDDDELGKIWSSAQRFSKKIQSQPGYVPPEKYRPASTLKPSDYSDVGQAKVLSMDCANELAFTTGTDFLVYNGKHWEESKPKAMGCMVRFLDRQLEDARKSVEDAEDKLLKSGVSADAVAAGGKTLAKAVESGQRDAYENYLNALAYQSFARQRRDIKYINGALAAVKPMVEIATKDLDSHEFLLNCPDGTYDLRKGMAGRREHDPSDYITQMTAFAPGDKGKDLWLASVNRTFQNDAETIEYVQDNGGLCLIGSVYQEAGIFSVGTGCNGKSTFWDSIAGAMGSYSGMISADALTAGCRRNVKPELAEVKGKRLLIAAELDEGKRLSTSIIKQLTSIDEIEGEKKYKDPFKFRPSHTLVLYTNHLPKVGAMDDGTWRRIIVIPFNASLKGNGEVKNYSKYLLDNAGPYILKWLIEGAERVIRKGFKLTPPKCVRDAISAYKAENDWMSHFLDDCCEVADGLEEKSGEVYAEYRGYCGRNGEFARSTTEFYKCLEQRGFTRHKKAKGMFIKGLKLAEQDF
jgi:P4 family phage/plasmid primase-like protien